MQVTDDRTVEFCRVQGTEFCKGLIVAASEYMPDADKNDTCLMVYNSLIQALGSFVATFGPEISECVVDLVETYNSYKSANDE